MIFRTKKIFFSRRAEISAKNHETNIKFIDLISSDSKAIDKACSPRFFSVLLETLLNERYLKKEPLGSPRFSSELFRDFCINSSYGIWARAPGTLGRGRNLNSWAAWAQGPETI